MINTSGRCLLHRKPNRQNIVLKGLISQQNEKMFVTRGEWKANLKERVAFS